MTPILARQLQTPRFLICSPALSFIDCLTRLFAAIRINSIFNLFVKIISFVKSIDGLDLLAKSAFPSILGLFLCQMELFIVLRDPIALELIPKDIQSCHHFLHGFIDLTFVRVDPC